MLDEKKIQNDFPFLNQIINGKRVVFLDTAASAQKPILVIQSIKDSYINNYANINRGIYELSERVTEKYEYSRKVVQKYINASEDNEIIFTKSATESINLLAHSLLPSYLHEDDEIIITEMEHHANIVPWHLIKKNKNLILKYIPVDKEGVLDLSILKELITKNTKIISLIHCSNVLGTVNPIKDIIKDIRNSYPDIAIIIDGSQSIVHQKIDVQDLDCDFFVFSSHKLYGPTGVGIIYVKNKWYQNMELYQGGGDMISSVTMEESLFVAPPHKFEAGTPNIVGVIGLSSAIKYIENIGIKNIKEHEKKITQYALAELTKIPGIKIFGRGKKVGVISFTIKGYHPNDIGTLLNLSGICVRVGQHCAHPLLKKLEVSSLVRVSFGVYNKEEDVDLLIKSLKIAMKMLK